ncbi:SWI/SNF-related matrix-associated actin-dependent regulator of chromatin subfamily A containing DEAD/H box 1 homolog isoform X2 [Parasteatoda tepidariorum]|uniref:SWI/SNF-related matrix-associated actin-dependent regulator of chromatin subfamily A containing DEAD/H box 1 homolog isoform X2 n=1 Tax=Parasteatoda tepidariorum TaxID=114398 RepID=UPI001C71B3F7|nr:SWI/SNF-related matrix-associated actin-dependent regulator of chromatin subfamily A containing DEAD/H box 1 homolog isoform X2 [Parasteatoda tepidariorum]
MISHSAATAVNYSPLSYRKYEISHTSQFILPCVLTKIQQACKKNQAAVIDLPLNLTEEEYSKLKELVLKEGSLGEKWKSNVIETTSYITCGFRELKVNRSYISELAKHIRVVINCNTAESAVNSTVPSSPDTNNTKPLRTYSRTSKASCPQTPEPVQESVSSTIIENRVSPTKGIMDEYEVFCEKELNLRKLLDAFPGADIMEAQDILVKCNWNLDEAVKIAHAQPLRCSKKKALSQSSSNSIESVDLPQNSESNNIQPSNLNTDMASNVAEEIVLDSSDEEFNESIKQMNNNKRQLKAEGAPPAKRVRKVVSSSESDEESSCSSNQTSSLSDHVNSRVSSSVNNGEQTFSSSSSLTIKPISNSSNNSEETKPASPANNLPNLPKGLVITQLGSSTTKLVSDVDTSTTNTNSASITMKNSKAEIITIKSNSLSNSSVSPNKSAQLVRIQSPSNGTSNAKPSVGYTVHPVGSVVSLPATNKESTSSLNKSSSDVKMVALQGKSSSGMKSKHSKVRHKKYVVSDDEDDDYGNEDVYDSEDSDIECNLTAAHAAVLRFFQEASFDELSSIPGCSKKKVDAILNLKPFTNWLDLVQKLSNDKALSPDLLNGAKKVLDMRNAISKLMAKCQQISLDMEDLVESLKENRESSTDYVDKQPDLLNDNMHLAPYQMLGLNWLLLLHNQEVNGILADEMGLGKTVQAISFLAYLKQIGMSGPHLIVVPSSTLDNWKQELKTWWPTVSVICYHGSQESRRELRIQILNDEVEEFDVMITTYSMVTSNAEDRSFFKRLEFLYVVFDEAHMLKNMSSQRYQHLMRIRAPRRLLLTGTPLQNNLVELMSLLIFAMPHMFSGKTEQIKQMFSAVSKTEGSKNSYEKERIDHAKRIMKPFVLRRLKKEVLKDLPAKHDEIRFCIMVDDQEKKYNDLIKKFSAEVQKNKEDDTQKISSSGSGMMMQLRRAANHPLLLRHFYNNDKLVSMSKDILKEPTHTQADPNLVFEDMTLMSDFELHKTCKNFKSLHKYILPDELVLTSGKFQVLDELIPSMLEEDHRILLFSQFTMVLDIVEEYMNIKKYKFLRLDGQTPVSERQEMIDKFNNDESISLFLLSTKAGGLGINLTAADTVIIHDIDFNPYNDKQAEDRCHRVGQVRDVRVIRFISKNTIEEGILQSAKEKLKLERDIHDETDAEENDSANVAKLLRDALGLKNTRS